MPIIIILVVVVFVVVVLISTYNNLVKLKNNRSSSFSDVEVLLEKRLDLIPNLVSTVKGYAAHEKELLIGVTEARAGIQKADGVNERIQAEQKLDSILKGINIQVEAYPELKADKNFMELQNQLSQLEDQLSAQRKFFNDQTRTYNTAVESFPGNFVAGMYDFKSEPYYEVSEAKKTSLENPPKVEF